MFAGEAGTKEFTEANANAKCEVARCAALPWRRNHRYLTDTTLQRACLIFQLNGYSFGAGGSHTALFEAGCTLAHACDSNVLYSSTSSPGRGQFFALRDIEKGESLTSNYLGADLTDKMSTPARRNVLLRGKLFVSAGLRALAHSSRLFLYSATTRALHVWCSD